MPFIKEKIMSNDISYFICRKQIYIYVLHIIFEIKYLISVQCIVLLERLSVTRQQPAAGWQQWSHWHHMAVPGNMHAQTLHRYPGRHWHPAHCYLRLTTDTGADKQVFNKTRSFWPVMRAGKSLLRQVLRNLTC